MFVVLFRGSLWGGVFSSGFAQQGTTNKNKRPQRKTHNNKALGKKNKMLGKTKKKAGEDQKHKTRTKQSKHIKNPKILKNKTAGEDDEVNGTAGEDNKNKLHVNS